ncbi:hypothetical protein GmHk_10G029437 [Glycine max]|nr:hypothetical protein GmHk_10G029437 [Glycine max]
MFPCPPRFSPYPFCTSFSDLLCSAFCALRNYPSVATNNPVVLTVHLNHWVTSHPVRSCLRRLRSCLPVAGHQSLIVPIASPYLLSPTALFPLTSTTPCSYHQSRFLPRTTRCCFSSIDTCLRYHLVPPEYVPRTPLHLCVLQRCAVWPISMVFSQVSTLYPTANVHRHRH